MLHALFTALEGQREAWFVLYDTSLPADTGPQVFCTLVDNQHAVKLEVWEQAGSVASDELGHNTRIGEGVDYALSIE